MALLFDLDKSLNARKKFFKLLTQKMVRSAPRARDTTSLRDRAKSLFSSVSDIAREGIVEANLEPLPKEILAGMEAAKIGGISALEEVDRPFREAGKTSPVFPFSAMSPKQYIAGNKPKFATPEVLESISKDGKPTLKKTAMKTGENIARFSGTVFNLLRAPANLAAGALFGTAGKVAENILTKKPLTEDLGEGVKSGVEVSFILPVTNKLTDSVLSKVMPRLVEGTGQVSLPFKVAKSLSNKTLVPVKVGGKELFQTGARNAAVIKGVVNSIERAIAETPAETVGFGAWDALKNDKKFLNAVSENFIPTLFGNLAFGAGRSAVGAGGVGLKSVTDKVGPALKTAIRNALSTLQSEGGYINFGELAEGVPINVEPSTSRSVFGGKIFSKEAVKKILEGMPQFKKMVVPPSEQVSFEEFAKSGGTYDDYIRRARPYDPNVPKDLALPITDNAYSDLEGIRRAVVAATDPTSRAKVFQDIVNHISGVLNSNLNGKEVANRTERLYEVLGKEFPDALQKIKGQKGSANLFSLFGLGGKGAEELSPGAKVLKKYPGKTIGEIQRLVQDPDLTSYENAVKGHDFKAMDVLSDKHPGDARFAIHRNNPKFFGEQYKAYLDFKDKYIDFERRVFGSEIPSDAGGKPKNLITALTGLPGKVQEPFRKAGIKVQSGVSGLVERGLLSDNQYLRGAAGALHSIFGGLGITPERGVARDVLQGGISRAYGDSNVFANNMWDALKGNEDSLKRVQAVLDPDIAEKELFNQQLSLDDLSGTERGVAETLRLTNDLIHEWNFINGFITEDTYLANKGKYIARAYDEFELPAEVNSMVKGAGAKLNLDIYKARGELDEWKIEHAINDPVYVTAKRLAQTMVNDAVRKYTNLIDDAGIYTSDIEKEGFKKLSNSPIYGRLSGKYIANTIAEDLQGFFFSNKFLQGTYDVFKMYDSLPPRQFYKKLLTVWNPTVQVGNAASDNVFGFLVGVDPLTLNSNLPGAIKEVKNYGPDYRYLLERNILRTDFSRSDLVKNFDNLDKIYNESVNVGGRTLNVVKKLINTPQEVYGATDDIYKIAAFKSLMGQGFQKDDAVKMVADGFQNYKNVGKVYDFASKTPLVGNAFIKFQADLTRILKNAVINRPLSTAAFLGTLKLFGDILSTASGEKPEERNIRETRAFIPKIPILDLPLVFQTPSGELNLARYLSPYYVYTDPNQNGLFQAVAKFLPYQPQVVTRTSSPSGTVGVSVGKSVQDPLFGPLVQLLANSDFRGKPITDPEETKYTQSTLTFSEKAVNAARFLWRQYAPQTEKDVEDFIAALKGKPDYYKRFKTPQQAFLRFFGIRVEQFGPEEVKIEKENRLKYAFKDWEFTTSQIKKVEKLRLEGKIDDKTAQKRIDAFMIDLERIGEEIRSIEPSAVNPASLKERFTVKKPTVKKGLKF